MDYQFRHDVMGQIKVALSMEHEALARWLNDEIDGNLDKIKQVQQLVKQAEQHGEQKLIGQEYSLQIIDDAIIVQANITLAECDELPEDMHYYDDESISSCGRDDFLHLLDEYYQFILNR